MKIKPLFLIIGLLLIFISGCWDVRDVNNTAFAVMIGLDRPANFKADRYQVILEFAEPIPGKSAPRSLVASAEGNSVLQAIQKIQTGISRTISFSHLRVLIVGEKIAKQENFISLASYFMKEPEIALRLRLLFVQGEQAESFFEVKPKFGELLASELVMMLETQEQLSLAKTNHFYNFWLNLKTNHGTSLGSRVVLKGKDQKTFIREGAVVFKRGKLISWLSGEEAQAANWIVDKIQAVVVAKDGANSYACQIANQKTKITPSLEKGK